MSSKSLPTTNSGQCRRSGQRPGCSTDPINHAVKDCRSEGSKTSSKRKSEESLERASKRSRTSQSPSSNQTFSGPSSIALVARCKKTSAKRKSTDDEREERPRKRSKGSPSPSEDPDQPTTSKAPSRNKPGTSSSVNTGPPHSRAAFEAKYEEQMVLGRGGYGTVCAGRRKHDDLPVALKSIPHHGIQYTSMQLDGRAQKVPLEVALLLKLKPVAAVVNLLDWYSLDHELVLVLERPVPCLDLIHYMNSREWSLQEDEVKAITTQLVNALIEVHARGVFHRDIKLDNILIETGSDVPRVRLIDFGCGTFQSRKFTRAGTYPYNPPEWFQHGWYKGGPAAVWQVGIVLFELLHGHRPFYHSSQIMTYEPKIRDGLSTNCHSFLRSCLSKRPETRPTLKKLRSHPWLK